MAVEIPVQVLINAIDNASKVFKGVGSSVQDVGSAMLKIGAAPTAALLFSTKAAIDYETAFAGVRKTVDASEAEFAQLSSNLRGIAKDAPLSALKLSAITEAAGSLGISGVDNLTKFAKTIAQVGITTNLTEEEAAVSFARIATIMQMPIDQVDHMGSTVVDLGNKFATTEREITEFSNRIAGAGKIAGLLPQEVLAISAAMSSVGVEAEAGGTAVQKVLLDINQAAIMGGPALATFAKTAGLTIDEFKKAAPVDQFRLFVKGLGEAGDGAIPILENLGLTDVRLMRSFLSLANAGDLLGQTIDTSGKAWVANTALTAEAEKRYATTAAQMEIAKNRVFDLGITIGTALLPKINELLIGMQPFMEKLGVWIEQNPKLTEGILIAGAAIGVIGITLIALGAIIGAVGTIATAFGVGIGALAPVFAYVGTAITTVIGILGGPLTIAIVAVMALIALFTLAWKNNWFDIQGKTAAAIEFIRGQLDQMKTNVTNAFNSAKTIAIDKMQEMYSGIKGWYDKIVGFFSDILNRANDAISKAREAVSINLTGKRQFGGPVSSAGAYLVGEKGPEIFRPGTAGSITPNANIGVGGGGNTIQFIINASMIINSPTERRNIAEALYKDLVVLARSQNTTVQEMMGA